MGVDVTYEVKEAGLKLQTMRLCQPSQTGDIPLLVGNSKVCNPNLLFTYIYFLLPKPGTCDHYAVLHFIGKTVRLVIRDSRVGEGTLNIYLFIKLDESPTILASSWQTKNIAKSINNKRWQVWQIRWDEVRGSHPPLLQARVKSFRSSSEQQQNKGHPDLGRNLVPEGRCASGILIENI